MTDKDQPPSRPIKLEPWQRILAGIVGAPALGVGGASVLISENQAGSAALILLGGLAWLMALIGRVPDRMGKDGVAFEKEQPATTAMKEIIDDPEAPGPAVALIAQKFTEALRQQEHAPVPYTRATEEHLALASQGLAFRSGVLALMRRFLPTGAALTEPSEMDAASLQVDALIVREGDTSLTPSRSIGVEIKFGRPFKSPVESRNDFGARLLIYGSGHSSRLLHEDRVVLVEVDPVLFESMNTDIIHGMHRAWAVLQEGNE